MSRASDVRDALVAAISGREEIDETVEAFILPDFTREELVDGCLIGLRYANREVESVTDTTTVTIEIGVFGVIDFPDDEVDDPTPQQVRAAQVAAADACDAVVEKLIALWVPRGPLFPCGMADHRFHELRQENAYDVLQLHENGVWASVFQVDYIDTRDE